MVTATKPITSQELAAISDDEGRFELIDGALIEMSPTGAAHFVVVNRLADALRTYAERHPQVRAFMGEGGFLLGRNPDTVLAPDITILSELQVRSLTTDDEGFLELTPLIAIEVKSPSDREADIARKLGKYLGAGVQEVWWVRTKERQMSIHRPNDAPVIVHENETLHGDDLLPGFDYPLSDLFRK